MQKTIIAIIAVVVLAGIGVWAFTQTNQGAQQSNTTQQNENPFSEANDTEEENTEAAETAEVAYTNDGFSPETVTVEEGMTVTWGNESDGQMWVASSVHPTHGDLPELDQQSGVSSGGEFSFQFDQAGEWGYHNHLSPSNKGMVVVE